jgi:hypothetical protein
MENTVNITLDNNDLQVLNAALAEVPFKFAAPLIGKINKQIAEQRGGVPPEIPTQESTDLPTEGTAEQTAE